MVLAEFRRSCASRPVSTRLLAVALIRGVDGRIDPALKRRKAGVAVPCAVTGADHHGHTTADDGSKLFEKGQEMGHEVSSVSLKIDDVWVKHKRCGRNEILIRAAEDLKQDSV